MQVSVLSFLQVWEDLWTSPYVTKEDIISVAAKQSNLIPRNQPGPRIPQAKGKFLASWAGRDKNKNKVCRFMFIKYSLFDRPPGSDLHFSIYHLFHFDMYYSM